MKTLAKRTAVAALATGLALSAAACGKTGKSTAGSGSSSSPAQRKTLTVLAAASLTDTFTTLGKQFEASHPGVTVRFSFGGSSQLAQQIVSGAPADVFAAASPATMKTVSDAKDVSGTPAIFVRNRLVIAVPQDNKAGVKTLKDLSNPKVKVVLCAEQVPCGAAAKKALALAGIKVTPVSLEQDVKAALTKVELGEADAGLVYRTDVKAADGKVQGIDFPEAAKAINDYPIAGLAHAGQPALAGEFVQFILSAQAKGVLTQAGFESA